MLFTSSQFTISTTFLFLYGFKAGCLLNLSLLLSSLYFHRHYIETNGHPNYIYRCVDIPIAFIAYSCLLYNSNITGLTISIGIPITCTCEVILYNTRFYSDRLIGAAGLHSLCHMFAIITTIYLPARNDIIGRYNILYILLISSFCGIILFIFFLPRIYIHERCCSKCKSFKKLPK